MSLRPQPVPPVPDATARVAWAAFPQGNLSLVRRDAFGAMGADDECAPRCPTLGQPAEAPWRFALVLVMRYVADCSDRQAADAGRRRLDGQDALRLARADPGFDRTVFRAFRTRVVRGAAAPRILDAFLAQGREPAWRKARGRQRTDSSPVLAQVRAVTRLACGGDTLRPALTRLAPGAPPGRQAQGRPAWAAR